MSTDKRIVAIDIETMANPALVALLPEPEVALGNLKDPEKIASKTAEAKDRQIKRAALDPHCSEVLAIGIANYLDDAGAIDAYVHMRVNKTADDERRIIYEVWDAVHNASQVVTFNGAGFDMPFLLRRSLLLNITPPRIELNKYRVTSADSSHLDLCELLRQTDCGDCHPGNLAYWTKLLLPGDSDLWDTGVDKSRLREMWESGELAPIVVGCRNDVVATLRLRERLMSVYN